MTTPIPVAALFVTGLAAAASAQPTPRPTPQTPWVWVAPVAPLAQLPPAPPLPPFPDVTPPPQPPAPPVPPVPWDTFKYWTFDWPMQDLLSEQSKAFKAQTDAFRAQTEIFRAQADAFGQKGPRGQGDAQYNEARLLIEQNRYDKALDVLDRVIAGGGGRVEAAMYWRAYSLAKLTRRPEALATLADLQKTFPKGRWLKDAQALDVEVRQAAGQSVPADAQFDEEIKLLALRGLVQSDPETALPVIEKILMGPSSVRVKDRALFVVSQSRSTRSRALILGVAKGNSNPDLQMRAIRYLGMMGGAENVQALDDLYRASSDEGVKRELLRFLMTSGAREKLMAVARTEASLDLRSEAVRQLGVLRAGPELDQLYRTESSRDVKKQILQAMHVANHTDGLAAIARSETDAELRGTAIHGLSGRPGSNEILRSLYTAESSVDTRKAVIEALATYDNAKVLVDLARVEKTPALKTEIVQRLSTMRSPEAREFLLELLK